VANTLGCNAIEVMGSRPSFGDISEIHFIDSIQFPAQRNLNWCVLHCVNLR